MCGIVGMFSKRCDSSQIFDMADMQMHRGPDYQGFAGINFESKSIDVLYKDTNLRSDYHALLGFNRLSIQDLTIDGNQPMVSNDKSVAILFNGEIYNTSSIKNQISNYEFKGYSDTEVILAAYFEYGFEKTIEKLNGMFAIALFDVRKNKIYFARDRVGIKPFYYTILKETNNSLSTLLFSSEIKSFLPYKSFSPELNVISLSEFFTFGDSVSNLLRNVLEVQPGEIIEFEYPTFNANYKNFFDLNNCFHPDNINMSLNDIDDYVTEKLSQTIERQLVGDVKIGCQLSGGIDSSLISFFVGNSNKDKYKTAFSIILDDADFSEESYIDNIVKKTGFELHKIALDTDYVYKNIPKAVWHYESILTYHNTIALLLLAEKAKEYVSVLLSGEGADELFAGYTWFEDGYFVSRYLELKNKIFNHTNWLWLEQKIRGLNKAKSYSKFAVTCTDTIDEDIARMIFSGSSIINYNRDSVLNQRIEFFNSFSGSNFDKHVKYEMSTRMRSLLMRQDKTAMASSIENRVPFLDNEIIDLAFSLPENVLIQNIPYDNDTDHRVYTSLRGKSPLKRISSSIYGKDFAFRRKVGFPLPFHKYLYFPMMKEFIYDEIFPGIKRRGFMNTEYIKQLYETMDLNNNRWSFQPLWKAITFEIFCKQFIDKNY